MVATLSNKRPKVAHSSNPTFPISPPLLPLLSSDLHPSSLAHPTSPSVPTVRFDDLNQDPKLSVARRTCPPINDSDSDTVVRQNSSITGTVISESNPGRVREVKVLLLGQSGAGKSTLQTNLHIHLSPSTFASSQAAYKPVIYLNIVNALHALLIELDYQLSAPSVAEAKFAASFRQLREELQLDKIRVRLLPLMALESLLVAELTEGVAVTPTATPAQGKPKPFVRPGWQDRIAPGWTVSSKQSRRKKTSGSDLVLLCAKTLASSVSDIRKLWNHWITRFYVSKRVVPLDDTAPYFLDHVERIGAIGYFPTNDDILHARIETLGVAETEFTVPSPMTQAIAWKWKVYDVSGIRGQRKAWIPFFDDASVIIFLAPISAFDQYLSENPSINCLADSLHLWASMCSNKLLQHARLVLFLNKIDLLKKKLDDGVCVRNYITSFSNRPNDFLTATSYFRAQFERIHQRKDVARGLNGRSVFIHFTSMLDTKAMVTQCVVSQVKEAISRKYASEVSMRLV